MWFWFIIFGLFTIMSVVAIVWAVREGNTTGIICCSICVVLCLFLEVVGISVGVRGNREITTYTFSSKNYDFKKEIVVNTTIKETEDGLIIIEDRDTLYILTGIEKVLSLTDDEGRTVNCKTLDLRKNK